ncbi:MAG: hypothetical protein KatS3mg102_0917 [Planctomycetota bacterium]|nr:MAG: hypothetical protein KatS3mg102_0917 [Planctomycetota bacterium]
MVVECLTDNKNRTAPEIRKLFELGGGKLGGPGSTAWLFEKKGVIVLEAAQIAEDELLELALEAGAEDMTTSGGYHQLTVEPAAFEAVRAALERRGLTTESCELALVPKSRVVIEDPAVARKVVRFLELLDDHDDVQSVASNELIACELEQEPART